MIIIIYCILVEILWLKIKLKKFIFFPIQKNCNEYDWYRLRSKLISNQKETQNRNTDETLKLHDVDKSKDIEGSAKLMDSIIQLLSALKSNKAVARGF